MGIEIERKFLVTGDGWRGHDAGTRLRQGYLCSDGHRTVRIRTAADHAWLTIKGAVDGISRTEMEYTIPLADALELLKLCTGDIVTKTRYRVPVDGMIWEVDEFDGANAGLIIAEIELDAVDQPFTRPEWAGDDVSHDGRYANASLSRFPFSHWKTIVSPPNKKGHSPQASH